MKESIFKAYDIRGLYPSEIGELEVYKIAQAYCKFVKPSTVVVGSDVRLSSPLLKRAAIKAVTDAGVKVIDVGEISTDMLYFSVANYGYDGGFSLTASHNPREYNGMKCVREESKPISSDSGLFEIRDIAMGLEVDPEILRGEIDENLVEKKDILDDYVAKIRTFADFSKFRDFKIVANANFGLAGRALDKLLEGTDISVEKLNYEPDGSFPKGRPDPLIPENRGETSNLVRAFRADFGVAWDADADRCFFFTEKGEFIEGYFVTALLAKIFLQRRKDEKIIHDTRLTWAVEDIVARNGGVDVPSKAGHSFIKERMRKENAVFGGEMSAHYYFRDYFFCDNGMIPLVMMMEFLSTQKKTLSEIMHEMFWRKYFVSGEINTYVNDVQAVVAKAKEIYMPGAVKVDETDGISIDHADWRFNFRGSNTEPLIRLNVEAKSQELMEQKTKELLELAK
ncbi:MAG: phosphomannomutase/phosphoglucomutase [Candidatus Moranbacteria bacterium]|nr:phosphomannomutase/phosphoglucomutase [Candidatus Moranbacteria bacterium]